MFQRILCVPLLALMLSGCEIDTQIFTTVSEDGSVDRKLSMQLKGVKKEDALKHMYPAKQFMLPGTPGWKVTESQDDRLSAEVRVKPGADIPGGYTYHLKALDRYSRNTVKLQVRDHFISTSYRYEERFADTVKAQEFKAELLSQFDRISTKHLAILKEKFGDSHDLEPTRKYLQKNLRALFVSTADSVERSGLYAALATTIIRLRFGGFPIKNLSQLLESNPRDVIGALYQLCLGKIRLKPDRALKIDEKKFKTALELLSTGTVDQQARAKEGLVLMGACTLRRLDRAMHLALSKDPKSGAAIRMKGVADTVRSNLKKRMDALVLELVKDTESYFLHPPKEKKVEVEKGLARMLGVHIEANFAPMEYFFLLRLKMPGEMVQIDRMGRKLMDGTVRWNFSAVNFFVREKVCFARSRVWKKKKIASLGVALRGDPNGLTLRMQEQLDELFTPLSAVALKKMRDALQACVASKNRDAITRLQADESESKTLREVAKKCLEIVPPVDK